MRSALSRCAASRSHVNPTFRPGGLASLWRRTRAWKRGPMSRIPEVRRRLDAPADASEHRAMAPAEGRHVQAIDRESFEGKFQDEAAYLDAAAGGEFLDDRLRLRE